MKLTLSFIVALSLIFSTSLAVPMKLRFATLTDVHIGESCHGDLSYEGCQPTKALTEALKKINSLEPPIDVVFMTGDLTSSALETEFQKNHDIMVETLSDSIPWFPLIGNHDAWPYHYNSDGSLNQTDTPIGDQIFAKVYSDQLINGKTYGKAHLSHWPESSCVNGDFGYQTWHHNFLVKFPTTNPNFYVLNLDWVAREAALPEAGVGPQAELHAYPCGTFDWLDNRLKELKALPNSDDIRIFIMQHHPFRNRDILDPYGKNLLFNFTFDDKQDARIQNLIGKYFPPSSILGSQAGHMHIWLSEPGFSPYTAISNEWGQVMAFETSACKGWAYDADVIGAFSVFNFEADSHLDPPKLVEVEKFWILPRDEHWIRETEYCTVDRCRNKTAF